jgi:hypothetical protein
VLHRCVAQPMHCTHLQDLELLEMQGLVHSTPHVVALIGCSLLTSAAALEWMAQSCAALVVPLLRRHRTCVLTKDCHKSSRSSSLYMDMRSSSSQIVGTHCHSVTHMYSCAGSGGDTPQTVCYPVSMASKDLKRAIPNVHIAVQAHIHDAQCALAAACT